MNIRPILLVLSVLTAAVALACGGGGNSDATATTTTSTPTPSPTAATGAPAPSGTPLPLTQGGTIPPIVTQVIAAVSGGQAAALEGLVAYQQVGCTTAQGAGGPPKCKPGQANGTVVSAFATGTCEGEWVEAAQPRIADLVNASGLLYTAVKVKAPSPDPEPYWPKGESLVYFRGKAGTPGTYFVLSADKIVRAHRICELQDKAQADAFIQKLGGTDYLVPPTVN